MAKLVIIYNSTMYVYIIIFKIFFISHLLLIFASYNYVSEVATLHVEGCELYDNGQTFINIDYLMFTIINFRFSAARTFLLIIDSWF